MSVVLMHVRAELAGDESSLDSMHELFATLWDGAPSVTTRDRVLFSIAVAEIAANVIEHVLPAYREWALDLTAWDDHLEASIRHPGPVVERGMTGWEMPGEDAESGRGLALAAAASSLHYSHSTDPEGSEWRVVHELVS
ncbi:MAG: ATP-binding protein [Acidobacteriota bacterium]|nr:ATP-binding protein [Acidobacteriota bacterium]MDE3107536.1 ATP-binding protein [Acidobacteriota bacterium]MDE3222136.1 ATP-binding protein [Acidobacteriota bacterium]